MTNNSNHQKIEMEPIESIFLNLNAPKTHNRDGLRTIKSSLRHFGWKGGLLVDRDTKMIVAGNALWKAAKDLGHTEVPVIWVSFTSEADRRAFILAHNKTSEVGSAWDAKIVDEELKYLFEQKYEFEVTGFTTNDLDFAIVSKADPLTDAPVAIDAAGRAVTRKGDLWHVGPHRIYCGDSLDPGSFEIVLGGELADVVVSDAPYGVKVNGHVSTTSKYREFEMMSGAQTPAELTSFFRRIFRNCAQFSRAASIHFQFIDWRHVREMIDAADGGYTEFKNICVWDKGSGSLGAMYRSQHEFCLVFKSGRGRHVRNFATGTRGRYRTNVWKYDGQATFGKDRAAQLDAHPTPKSVPMLIDAIRDCSNTGDLVLDPFCGSASAAVAAHHAGRRCATIEIDPLYVDASLKRLAAVTGEPIIHADGRTFDEVATARAQEGETDV